MFYFIIVAIVLGSQNGEYMKVRDKLLRLNNGKDIKQHEILVLILRLRQICCHPSLITEVSDFIFKELLFIYI